MRMNLRSKILAGTGVSAFAIIGWCVGIAGASSAQKPSPPQARGAVAATPAGDSRVARGDYLTHHVAMCVECHSPRDERGNIIEAEEFGGAPVLISQPYWRPDWAQREPNIAGLPGFTDDQVVTLLMTGRP